MKWPFLSFFFVLFFSASVNAGLEIPTGLNMAERRKALEILGLSSTTKLLGNPFPLGGYSGIEIGYTFEVIPTEDLSSLGNKTSSQSETVVSALTLGKGVYNNVDLYVQLSPFTQTESVSNYGGQVRWGFYQSEYLPAHLSVIAFASSTNFQNQISTLSQGTDLVAGFTVKDMTLYTGIGYIQASGIFMGGAPGITDTGESVQENISQSHYVAGVNIKFSSLFLAMQIDRYTQATYAAKLGLRF